MRSLYRPDWICQRLSRMCELGGTSTNSSAQPIENLCRLTDPQTIPGQDSAQRNKRGRAPQPRNAGPAPARPAGGRRHNAPHMARCGRGRTDITAKRMQNRAPGGPRSTAVRSVELSSNLNDLLQPIRTKSGNAPNDSLLKSKPTRSFSTGSCNFRELIDSLLTCRHRIAMRRHGPDANDVTVAMSCVLLATAGSKDRHQPGRLLTFVAEGLGLGAETRKSRL
jgi:hypothetical protein